MLLLIFADHVEVASRPAADCAAGKNSSDENSGEISAVFVN